MLSETTNAESWKRGQRPEHLSITPTAARSTVRSGPETRVGLLDDRNRDGEVGGEEALVIDGVELKTLAQWRSF